MSLLLGTLPRPKPACPVQNPPEAEFIHSCHTHLFISPPGAPGLGETELADHSELCKVRTGQGETRPEGERDLVPPPTGALHLPPNSAPLGVDLPSAQGLGRELGFPLSPDTKRPTAGTRAPHFTP